MNQSKFKQLDDLFQLIISDIKKDIKSELVKFDRKLFQKIFSQSYVAKLSSKELADLLHPEIQTGNPALEDWMIERWVYRHAEIYQFFVERLSVIHPDFETIKEIEKEHATKMVDEAIRRFGALKTYLFSILNGVAFTPATLQELALLAKDDRQ
ncbi:MAG: hypothetical protein KGZ39_03860 [Simkania sp.]|nr:hypothetical protein [Simkania sp.]